MKNNEQTLKTHCKDTGSAIACAIDKKTGESLIYVNPNADSEEIMKSLILAATQICQVLEYREG